MFLVVFFLLFLLLLIQYNEWIGEVYWFPKEIKRGILNGAPRNNTKSCWRVSDNVLIHITQDWFIIGVMKVELYIESCIMNNWKGTSKKYTYR